MTIEITVEENLEAIINRLEGRVGELEEDLDSALTELAIARGQASDRAKRVRELSEQSEFWRKKCAELEKQIEDVDVDFMRVKHAKEVEKLQGRIDHLEGVYWKMWSENEKLRELCRDMYSYVDVAETHILLMTEGTCKEFRDRMEQLGLLDGEQ